MFGVYDCIVVLEELCKGAFVSWFLDKDRGLDFDEGCCFLNRNLVFRDVFACL